eukprot:1156268-Pelagomonas_calceolata.AAC.1
METCTVYTPGKWKDLKPLTPDAECMGAIETKDASKFSSLAMDALAGTCIQCCASSSSAGTMQKESHTYSNLLQWISWPGQVVFDAAPHSHLLRWMPWPGTATVAQ